ncbi:hypothetical protein KIN20_019081 [Parelaphostrongylus tenuis]|uniref:glucuronosyltransferase n=1 Tax=Parelaphostrongylus tenuis TaxID=148309 RepID=A0AAD5MKI4_PARTN|nr:hypothetical protein KIN20_019081 [Parelaphostrongylus tenuis]
MVLCFMLSRSYGLQVLLWSPTVGSSHVRFMGNIADILAGDGHNVMIGIKKTVVMSALGITPYMEQVIGFPANPSYVPGFYTSYSDEMSFWERLDNFKFTIEMHYRLISWESQLHALANNAHSGFPDIRDLIKVDCM